MPRISSIATCQCVGPRDSPMLRSKTRLLRPRFRIGACLHRCRQPSTVSFDLDTLSADSTSYLLGTSGGGGRPSSEVRLPRPEYRSNVAGYRRRHDSLWRSSALNAHFAGDNPEAVPEAFSCAGLRDSTARFGASPDVSPGMSQDAFLHSGDPLRDLLLGFDAWSGTSALSRLGRLIGDTRSVQLRACLNHLPVYCLLGLCRC